MCSGNIDLGVIRNRAIWTIFNVTYFNTNSWTKLEKNGTQADLFKSERTIFLNLDLEIKLPESNYLQKDLIILLNSKAELTGIKGVWKIKISSLPLKHYLFLLTITSLCSSPHGYPSGSQRSQITPSTGPLHKLLSLGCSSPCCPHILQVSSHPSSFSFTYGISLLPREVHFDHFSEDLSFCLVAPVSSTTIPPLSPSENCIMVWCQEIFSFSYHSIQFLNQFSRDLDKTYWMNESKI